MQKCKNIHLRIKNIHKNVDFFYIYAIISAYECINSIFEGEIIMKTLKKLLCVVLAIAVVAVTFVACSSNNDDSKSDDAKTAEVVKVVDIKLSEEEYAFGVDKDQPELLEQVNAFLSDSKENLDVVFNHYFGDGEPVGVESAKQDDSKDQLIVATNAEFAPFEYKEGDKFYGIDMEIASLLAKSLGKELVIVDMAFDAVLLSVENKKADIGMAGLTVNPARAKQVNFSDSYYSAAQKVICKADDTTFDNCKTKEDVDAILNTLDSSALIGGQTGTTGQSYVEGSEEFGFEKLPATWKGYANGSLAVQDLVNGNIKYVIIDEAPASAIVSAVNAVA